MRDAVSGVIAYTSPEGKTYKLNNNPAVLLVRPRGNIHLLSFILLLLNSFIFFL